MTTSSQSSGHFLVKFLKSLALFSLQITHTMSKGNWYQSQYVLLHLQDLWYRAINQLWKLAIWMYCTYTLLPNLKKKPGSREVVAVFRHLTTQNSRIISFKENSSQSPSSVYGVSDEFPHKELDSSMYDLPPKQLFPSSQIILITNFVIDHLLVQWAVRQPAITTQTQHIKSSPLLILTASKVCKNLSSSSISQSRRDLLRLRFQE